MPGEATETAAEVPTAAKPVVGIIYPPPEVRNIVDKTANFVARNGPEFEVRIRHNEQSNAKFNFLTQGDPYHAYYQHKVKEIREGRGGPEPTAAPIPKTSFGGKTTVIPVPAATEAPVPKEPPPEWEFTANPPSISAQELDIVRLTAQFVARNGRQFLTNLASKEQFNHHFDFLRPQHSLFHYFTKLVEQYTKILLGSQDVVDKLQGDGIEKNNVLDRVQKRVDWLRFQERQQKQREEELDRERIAFASIDWHDFVVVETITFSEEEQGDLPPPLTVEQLGSRVLAEQRAKKMQEQGIKEVEMEVEGEGAEDEEDEMADVDEGDAMEMDEDEEMEEVEVEEPPVPAQPPPPPQPNVSEVPTGVPVRRDYNPRQKKPVQAAPEKEAYFVSPLTGEKIPESKSGEHMRFGLLDPRWKEQRDRQLQEKNKEEVYAAGGNVAEMLNKMAARRTDIFGVEETMIGQVIGEEDTSKKPSKVVWDGHKASKDSVRQSAKEEAAKMSLEQQIAAIQQSQGILSREEAEKIGPHPTQSSAPVQPRPPMPPALRPPMGAVQPVIAPPPSASLTGLARPPVMPGMPGLLPQRLPNPPPVGLPPRPLEPQIRLPVAPPVAPPTVPPTPPTDAIEEPASKRPRPEPEQELIPEDEFIQSHPGTVTFQVQVPTASEKAEWRLNGQTVSITLPITDPVSVVKAKLHEELGLPAGKQKLALVSTFLKDSLSLGYYNVTPASIMQLQLKERGGRKK